MSIEVTNPKTNVKGEVILQGLQSFSVGISLMRNLKTTSKVILFDYYNIINTH